jgi:hypothetical protein
VRRGIRGHETLRHGGEESLRTASFGRDSLVGYAPRTHFDRRRRHPVEPAGYPIIRPWTRADVDRFVRDASAT